MNALVVCFSLAIIGFGATARDIPINGRIVGGQDAHIEDYPYIVKFINETNGIKGGLCRGVIIGPKWVLTVAACLERMYNFSDIPENLQVQAGSSYPRGGDVFQISNVTVHPDYRKRKLDSNIALVELVDEVNCEHCKPINLTSTIPSDEEMVSILGWGVDMKIHNDTDLEEGDPYDFLGPPILQVARVPVVNSSLCNETYSIEPFRVDITENVFCTGYYHTGGVDICEGDTGGPVVSEKGLVGIISYGMTFLGCALPAFVSVHTLVPKYAGWIEEVSGITPVP